MRRAKFARSEQKVFFERVKKRSGLTWSALAQKCRISSRSLMDWRREKIRANYDVVKKLGEEFSLSTSHVKELPEYWYIEKSSSLGGKARAFLYGSPGTPLGRQKGGRESQRRRRQDPEKYKKFGCIVRKEFPALQPSGALAEMIGIILGDGGLTNSQLTITLHKTDDKKYAGFVSSLMQRLFGEKPSWLIRENTIRLIISGVQLVHNLEQVGLRRGNKVYHQVCIPSWIRQNPILLRSCLRGLFDTDGGFFSHRHTLSGKKYKHFGFCFSNSPYPLLEEFYKTLLAFKLKVKHPRLNRLYIYDFRDIQRFMDVIGSHNPKHIQKFKKYVLRREKTLMIRKGAGAV